MQKATILEMAVRLRVEEIPEGGKGVSHANIWDKSHGGKGNSTRMLPKVGMQLVCLGYSMEASVAGGQQGEE